MSREVRYAGVERIGRSPPPPSRLQGRGHDRGPSSPRRDRDWSYSPRGDRYALPPRTRGRDYSPLRSQERDCLPPRARGRRYSPPRAQERRYSPSREQERYYSPHRREERKFLPPRAWERHNTPPRARDQHYLSPRARERQNSPPRARDQHYLSPRGRERQNSPPRAREQHYLSPRGRECQYSPYRARERRYSPSSRMPGGDYLSPVRNRMNHEFISNGNVSESNGRREEYFHELERSRRMERGGGGVDIGEIPRVGSSSYGGERLYRQSQNLRLSENDSRNGDQYCGPTDSRRKYELRDGLAHGDLTSAKYQFSSLNDARKSDASNDPVDNGLGGARVTNELGNEGRPYMGYVDSRAISSEVDRRRLYSSYDPPPLDASSRNSGFDGADGYASESHNLYVKLQKSEQNPFQGTVDKSVIESQRLKDGYMGTETLNSLHHSKYDPNYVASSHVDALTSRSPIAARSGISSSFGEDIHIPSDGMRTRIAGLNDPIRYRRTSDSRSPRGQADDMGIYSQSYFAQPEERCGSRIYLDSHGAETVTGTRPSELYMKNAGVREEHIHQGVSGPSFVDPITYDEFSQRENLTEDKSWDYIPSQVQSTLGYFGASGALEKRKQEMNFMEYGDDNPNYERVVHKGYRDLYKHRDYDEMDEHLSTLHERSDVLYRDHYPQLDRKNDSLEQRLIETNQILPRSSTGMLKRKYDSGRELSIRDGYRITTSSHGRSASRIIELGGSVETCLDGDKGSLTVSKRFKVNRSKYGKNIRKNNASTQHGRKSLSTAMASRLSKTGKHGARDIKKRLGPHPQDVGTSHSSVKNKSSLKHRLGPRPKKSHSTLPWLKNVTLYKGSKDHDDVDENVPEHVDDPLESSVKLKSEPPEKSEDFKQLVHNAFFKFVKHLNETPARRRKYRKQGASNCLKCIICGRDSEEFGDVESLVTHALTSSKAGVRSQHLGFHKALCVLMGWKSAEAPDTSWVREELPEDETSALKEDLIIWPPVVVIHNITITNKNQDESVIVSVEDLEAKLKDKGLGGKVSRGKPANQSVLVVKFAATLSGLQEAERLVNLYAETKHGRAELQRITSDGTKSSDSSAQTGSENKADDVLYGCLGNVEDLDKLDFETKKRSKVKSKKEIQNIALKSSG